MTYSYFYQKCVDQVKLNAREIQVAPGEPLVKQGEKAGKVVLLLKGKVKVVHHNSKGDEFIIGFFDDEELFGHLECHTGDTYAATVTCVNECKVVIMPGESYFHWFKSDAEFAMFVHKGMSKHIIKDSRRIVENNFFPLEYHILKFIIEESDDFKKDRLQFVRNELAAYTGAQLRSVNRILKSLVDDKLIEIDKDEILIMDQRELEMRFMRNL